MSNQIIIDQFEKLINYVQKELDDTTDIKKTTANKFRLKQLKNALLTIKKYHQQLTLDNLVEFKELPGIGKGTIDRITEIIKSGKLKELEGFIDITEEDKKALEDLESIVGVGRTNALKFIKMGIKSVNDLKNKIKNKEIEVNEKIMLGIKYYGVFEGNIPRNEITKIKKFIDKIIKNINKSLKLDDNNKYIFEICGSYRREKQTSGDIDVLVSKLTSSNTNSLEIIVNKLKEEKLLVDDITDKNFETKYMGFAKYKNNPVRRIDIRFIPFDSYYSALLYFTGSAELNKKMRQIAIDLGYKLSEYGIFKNNQKINIQSEEDIFKILKLEYLPPNLR